LSGAGVRWLRGGTARIVTLAGDAIVLRSSVPAPPGSRIEGALDEGFGQTGGAIVRVKVHTCRRQPEGDFLLEGRPLDLTRELRERMGSSQ
jgi:hypothetical protein